MSSTLQRLLATTALVGGLALASPVYAADSSATATDSTTTTTSSTSHHHWKGHGQHKMDVEARIKTLHDKLGITAAQEDDWTKVAQAMRDSDSDVKSLIKDRHDNAEAATAVDDLESYQKIAQAHVDGLGKVVDAFKPLYDSFSDDQKKTADEVFGSFEGHRGNPEASKSAPAAPAKSE